MAEKKGTSVRAKIIGIVILSVVVCVAAAVLLTFVMFDLALRREAKQSLEYSVSGMDETLSDWNSSAASYAAILARDEKILDALQSGDLSDADEEIQYIIENTDSEMVAVIGRNGRILLGSKGVNVGADVASFKSVQDALSGEAGSGFEEFAGFDYLLYSTCPVEDDEGNVIGCVVVGFDMTSEFVEMVKASHGTECSVLKGDKVLTTTLSQSYVGMSLGGTEAARTVLDGGERYTGQMKIGKTLYYIVCGPIMSNGKVTGIIFSGKDIKIIAETCSKAMRVIVPVVVVLLALISFFLYKFVIGNLRSREQSVGAKLIGETQSLSVAAKENAATSQDQSAAVKEIVATMEDNNALAETIAKKITDVSGVAGKTNGSVHEGVALLSRTVEQLSEIAGANQTTIDGIKSLGEKIENIWDIVTLINSVADQAKIIAFNAELEASSAGEAGKNFHIVATEIRRLADGIIDGTKEIKERINEIQQSSDSLILASENGTAKINEGREGAKALEAKFAGIKDASEITVQSAGDITGIVRQQTAASEQILATLRQIALGIENFTQATESISNASENLRVIAEDLNK